MFGARPVAGLHAPLRQVHLMQACLDDHSNLSLWMPQHVILHMFGTSTRRKHNSSCGHMHCRMLHGLCLLCWEESGVLQKALLHMFGTSSRRNHSSSCAHMPLQDVTRSMLALGRVWCNPEKYADSVVSSACSYAIARCYTVYACYIGKSLV